MKYISIIFLLLNRQLGGVVRNFPPDFKFGAATASYQIEGGHCDGKGETIWDRFINTSPERILQQDNSEIACDSYHKYKEDVANLKYLGVHFYRFSLAWSRILPTGFIDNVNNAGVEYYKNLISELKQNGIEPYVTLYHWDLPQPLQDLGGWPNPQLIHYFAEYAKLAFQLFGDDVKVWFTFNEPKQTCLLGYGTGHFAPGFNESGVEDYKCAHNVLKAHAHAYHIYNDEFRLRQNGKISFVVDSSWFEPASSSPTDLTAAERMLQFSLGWFANPVYHKDGNYPQVMINRIAENSFLGNFSESRLPKFTDEEVDYIKGTYDFFSLNTYTTNLVKWKVDQLGTPNWFNDVSVTMYTNDSWPSNDATSWLKVVPSGMRKLLKWVHLTYDKPIIFIAENGYYDDGRLIDTQRIKYLTKYLKSIHMSMVKDKVNVCGYAVWSLMDNFEWLAGYSHKFGLYHVNFLSPNRTRTIKESGNFYKKLIETMTIPFSTIQN